MLFSSLTAPTLRTSANELVVLLPLGAIEQHGPHLSVSTDTDIVTRIAQEAEKALAEYLLLCPTLPFGSSDHHISFGGTISIGAELYTRVITDLVTALLKSGFRKIVLLNGHGGNITPVKQALAVLSRNFDYDCQPNIVLATYWELAGAVFAGAPPMESPALSHACEYETSLMLHLFPEKVKMEKAARAKRPADNGYIPWEDDIRYRGITQIKQTAFISDNGSSGEPQKGTAAKGEHLFNQACDSLIAFLNSFKNWPLLPNLTN
jgi:creatinine amidohydrolase